VDRERLVEECWELAKRPWGFVQLRHPVVYWEPGPAQAAMGGQIAFFNFAEKSTFVNYPALAARGAGDYLVEILSHEIGHHMAVPADPPSDAILLHAAYRGLGLYELPEESEELRCGHQEAVFWVNLFADVLVNTVLYHAGLRVIELYRKLTVGEGSPLWRLYLRTLELLWDLPPGTLVVEVPPRIAQDAERLRQIFTHMRGKADWTQGVALFVKVFHPYWPADTGPWVPLLDYHGRSNYRRGGRPGADPGPGGMERSGGKAPVARRASASERRTVDKREAARDEHILGGLAEHIDSPANYRRLLKGLGFAGTEAAEVWYYRDLARKFAVKLPATDWLRGDDHPEGLARWEPGDPPEELDLFATLTTGGLVLPAVTTVKRESGTTATHGRGRVRPWLLLVLDASGSMPNPRYRLSHAVLAAFILAESALNAGVPVAAVVFSGDYESADYTTDRDLLGSLLVRYPGQDTYFPGEEVLRLSRAARAPVYLCVISDVALHNAPEALEYLAQIRQMVCGGTLCFIYRPREQPPPDIRRMLEAVSRLGYQVRTVTSEEELRDLSAGTARELYPGL